MGVITETDKLKCPNCQNDKWHFNVGADAMPEIVQVLLPFIPPGTLYFGAECSECGWKDGVKIEYCKDPIKPTPTDEKEE